MRILFVCSGNRKANQISPFIQSQAKSLIDKGIFVDFFIISQPGLKGYFRHIFKLKKFLRNNNYDIVHAHYSLSAIVASLAKCNPLVVSLLGSDAYQKGFLNWLTKLFYRVSWSITIVKTEEMKQRLGFNDAIVLPNGVNILKYKPIDYNEARQKVGFLQNKKLILFIANPDRHEKNFTLAQKAINSLNRNDVELLVLYNKPSDLIPYYMNAADLLLLTSKWEGSVNVVKEAMACNLKVVSTDVGDVKQNTKGLLGYYVCEADPKSIAIKIEEVLMICKSDVHGRGRILELELDSESVANKLITIYNSVIKK